MGIIQLEKIEFGYPGNPKVLNEISLELHQGEMVLLCGLTGSGKTTLLRGIKDTLGDQAGMVLQNPEHQIVQDKVYGELAFGLTNYGYEDAFIRRRIGETAAYFGISKWLWRDTATLSGGEKQLLNLASVMAMHPKVLLLDEPTAMLDPIMAQRLNQVIDAINRDLGTTILISNHQPEDLFHRVDRVLTLHDHGIFCMDTPINAADAMISHPELQYLLPLSARAFYKENPLPLSVREGRFFGASYANLLHPEKGYRISEEKVLELKGIRHGYEAHMEPVIRDLNLTLYRGEVFGLLGENGSGKSTLSKIAAGALQPYHGTVRIFGKKLKSSPVRPAMLFQNVTSHFLEEEDAKIYGGVHPYDRSGGEQQMLALELVLAKNPEILILDEPAKGLDGYEKTKFIQKIRQLKQKGVTILMVTHDVELAASLCDRMGMLFHGNLESSLNPTEFCRENLFYTTAIGRMFRGYQDQVLTLEDLEGIYGGRV